MPIPPEFDIVDPHIHQWDVCNTPRSITPLAKRLAHRPALYHWVLNRVASKALVNYVGKPDFVAHDYLPHHYYRDNAGLNVSQIVHVEAKWKDNSALGPVGETQWVNALFSGPDNATDIELAAIVGHVNLNKRNVRKVINAHRRASNQFVGVRHMLAWDADKGVMNFCKNPHETKSKSFRKGFELLEKYNLSFDTWGYHTQLNEIAELVAAFPNTQFVLCHMGTPIGAMGRFASYGKTKNQRDSIIAQWKDGLANVASNPNVVVKLSGMFMPVLGWGLHQRGSREGDFPAPHSEIVDRLSPFINYTIEQFSVNRCMFASNFPMDKISIGFRTLYDTYWAIVEDQSDEVKRKLFADNARKIYKIVTPQTIKSYSKVVC